MADKVTSLYNALKADGLFKQARSLNDFKAKMAYQGYRSQIYKLARDKGANVGTFSQFTNALGYSSGSPKPRQSYGSYHTQQSQKPATAAQKAMQIPYRLKTQLGKAPKSAPKGASPFVQSLYEIDEAQKEAGYPVDYTSPKATQQVYQRNQRVRRQAAKTASDHIANDEYRRQSQPMIDNGTVGVMKPMGEIEQEMSDSASKFVDANLGDYINNAVLGEQNAAAQRGLDAANRVPLQAGAGGMGLMVKGMAYNEQVDPDLMAKNLTDNARDGFLKLFQDPSFVAKLDDEAARLGVTPEAYIESIIPHLKDRLAATLRQSEYQKALPKNMLDNVANRFIDSNLTGQLLRLATQTRGQRVMQERASAATAAGENPYYKGSTAENVTADIGGFVADPLFGASAKLGGFVAGKLIGNSTKLAALMANGNLAQRLMARGAQAVTSGGVTGFVFDSTGSVIQNYSTGEDTSLGNTLKVAAKGGTTGAVNFATMSLAGIPLSEVGRSVGLKAIKGGSFWGNAGRATAKVGLESGKTYMEAMGMYLGGYVSGKLEGRTDANGKPIEFDLWNGTMESLPTAIGFRLQHAVEGLRGGRKNEKGEDMGWFGSTVANFKDFLTSDKAKESRFLMTEDERNMIFSSGAMNGLMPDGENIVSYAKRTKNKKVSYDDPYLETDASMIKNTYDQIMADPKVSWDAKAKFSAMVTGIMPSARPMMDYITFSSEDYVKDGLLRGRRKYVNEYSAKGELLSKIPYDNKEDRDNVVYNHNIKRENLRLYNAMGLLARQDRNNYELQNDFFVENMKKPGADVNTLVTNMGNEGSDVFRDFSLFALNSEKGTILNTIDSVAVRNGMKSEDLIKAMKKNPMKRTDFEQNVCVELRRALEAKAFPDGKVHVEQSNLNGKDVAEDNNLGTEQPNGDAVKQELNGLRQAEAEMDALLCDNDVFSQNFKKLQNQGLTNPQIYDWMVQQGGLTVEQLEPFAHYINANARVQGMQEATKNAIDEQVSSYVQDWTFHGTLNGQEAKGEQAIFVQDRDGRTLLLGSGEIAFDSTTGRAKEGVGDMIVCLDPTTNEMVYLKTDDVTLSQTQDAENFGNEYRQKLQMINSQPYNEAAQKQAMIDAAKPQQENGKTTGTTSMTGDAKGTENNSTEQVNPELYKVANSLQGKVGQSLAKEEAGNLVSEMENRAEPARELDLTPENWTAEFGEDGKVTTPLGEVKMGENQYFKLAKEGRNGKLGLIKPTLENPDVIIEDASQAKEGQVTERHSSYLFVKAFTGKDGNRVYYFTSVTVSRDGKEVVVSNQERRAKRIATLMESGKILYLKGNQSASVAQNEKPVSLGDSNSSTTTGSQGALHGINSPDLYGKDTDNSSNGNGSETTLTFENGEKVPVDANGEPNFLKMTPEQGAEVYKMLFEEDAEKQIDSDIKTLEKDLKKVQNAKYDGVTVMERAEARKKAKEAIAVAEAQVEKAKAIKKTMTAQKVAETMSKPAESTEGANEASSGVAKKFANAPRLVGNKRTRMLADGETKIKGHYEIVPAESLTPSHDVNNGYKKSEGFPTDAEGRTVNDRDYEHDKAAQQNTDQIARKYNGMAIEQVPVVSDEGIVYDGNGRTMAGQKAAKEGTDGEYINDLLENAENFGFTREQIEQSGIEHPRLVLVTDERLPYDTATFSKFNRNEKKTQSNTEQAVAKAKTLTSDEVGAIVAEIEGSGSLDAFFNNSKAINDLVKTLVDKGIIGQNEVAQMMDNPERLSAQGREYVKNLLLGSIFKPKTIRMLGIDSAVKNKAVNAIRSVMDNMKLGDYSLRDEIDQAIQLLYEARQGGNKVDTLLRTPDMFGEDAANRYPSISQMMALALEGKVSDFRDLLDEYNRIAASRNTGEGNMFEAAPTKEELINEYLNFKKWQDYGTGHSENEGGNDVSGIQEPQQEASGGNGSAEEGEGRVKSDEANADKLVSVETEWQDKIDDYIDEHYPQHNVVRSRTPEEQAAYDAETEAMKKDPVLAQMRKDAENAYKEAEGGNGSAGEGTEPTVKVSSANGSDPILADAKRIASKIFSFGEEGEEGVQILAKYVKLPYARKVRNQAITYLRRKDLAYQRAENAIKNGVVLPGKEDAYRKLIDAIVREDYGDNKNTKPSADPIEGIEKAADAFRKEQKQKGEFVMNLKLGKARQEYAEAKERGDASEIKRTRDELKQLLDEHYKAQHMGLVQRRKEIAKEIGMTEAKKIDKPWSEMDGEERMATAEKSPLTEKEIRSNASDENQDLIEDAIDYINGNHGFAQQLAYLKIYEDVRNRHENATDNSGAENGAQLAPADNGSGEGLGLGTGRESGGTDGQLDRGTGNESAPGEPERREGDQNDSTLSVGKSGDKQGEGNSSDMGAVPAGNTNTKGSSSTGKDGNVSEQGGRGGSNRPAKPDAKRKPAAKQGTTWRGRTEAEIKQEHKDAKAGLKAALAEMLKRGRGEVSLSLVGLNSKQIEYVPELMKAVKRYGMSLIDQGIYKIKDWANNIREGIYDEMKEIGFSDQDIDDFIKEMWNSKMPMDGETHTIAEWCSIYGNVQLRKKLGEELDVKYQKQMDAEPIEVKIGDRKNIEETLPFLLPQQQDDVLKAETQFFGKDHTDREHAYGKGYMFTNGTGTGKTYTGLGIAKRLAKQGKGRILFITPSQKKVNDWMKDGKNLGLDIRDLDSVAKEKGTTATTESGDGMVITTFANFGLNKKLLETEWDAVIYDECHRIMENKKGAETARSMQHYMMTNRDENHCFLRLQTINPHYQKMQNAADRFNELRQKEVQRIQKEYKQSHPSATAKDVVNATFSQLPKELNSFALADATAFPKLGKAYQDFTSAKQHYYNNVEPKLKEQAKNTWKNTKTIFLSATPFNTRENLDYAEGYIFKFPEDDGSRMSGRSRFYLDHFGAAYRYRYNRLEAKTDNPAAVAKQEVAFSDYLQDTLGTMSGRIIDSAYDYSRDFPTVAPDHADEFNNAVEEAVKGRYLGEAYSRTIGDYNYGSALFETMKVANIIQRMKDHLAAGRKIVVFHRRVETKNPIQPPFAYMLDYANRMIAEMKPGKERNEAIKECTEFRNKYADLLDWEQTLDYSMPREQIAKVFGKDNVLFFSGKESKKVKDKAVDTFNDDNSGKNIIVIQEASGKEGISLHDVTGNHQRVLITLGLPQSPITALQIEGRTYRIGNKSNAIFEYPILGLNSEMMLFGQKFNNQVSTTENLALGSQARNLRDSFANGILEHSGIVPIDQQGVGGKEFDAPKQSDSDPFDDAVLDYYSNQKLNRNNREGVDYFPTPEPLGYKMVEWANMGEGDTALEPSAGHGAIARYVSKSNELLSIEPSQSLFAKLQLKAGGLGRKFLNSTFENYNVANKHDVVVMNPPFGTAGATAIAHLDKAFRHLDEGGRVVAIIPRGSTDKKFDKWYGEQKNVAMRAEVDLPDIVFQQAGTNVRCRVVVLDKITDNALRSKAGYPEKIDLSGHYDKIEDFFEDLRDVQMPDRIIDTQMKSMKKARTFKKDIEDIKGMTVTIEKNGISVFDKNAYRDYSISFPSIKHNEEWTKENYSKVYERFDQEQNRVYSENSKAALDEMKKLACKLAGMSEEEMQRYIASKNNGGTHFRESRGLQYSKSDTKDVKNSRIIPEDVDKNVSSQIEKNFEDRVDELTKDLSDKDKAEFNRHLDYYTSEFSKYKASEITYTLNGLENEVRYWERSLGNGEKTSRTHLVQLKTVELRAAETAARREMDYREVRAKTLEDGYGLRRGDKASFADIYRLFEATNSSKEEGARRLFEKACDIAKRLGVEFGGVNEGDERSDMGEAMPDRSINLFIDTLSRTYTKLNEAGHTIIHELIHQSTMGAIHLVKDGKAEGMLTPKQIEAVKTVIDTYKKAKADGRIVWEKGNERDYGGKDEYEFAAEMSDEKQRKILDLSLGERIMNAAKELRNRGDNSLWQALKNAWNKLFEVSDKSKMDKALNDIMDDFNEKIDDIAMNDIGENGYAYRVTDKDELDRLDKEKTFRMYSGMQEVDGKLYSPMAAIIDGKRTDATEIGAWMGADERPDLVKNGKFTLVKTDKNKGVGEGDVPAAYNPYMHTSTSMMNDQFTGAYARGNIKVVEWEIPESEKTSGYHAEGAKDAVGLVPWHSGSVNSLLPKDRQRQVMLSRWRKAVRVVPDSEVAESIAEQLKGTGLAIPWNTVTPNQVRELAKLGVPITTVESGRQAPETKEKFLQQMADLEQEFPQAKFVNVKMTKDAFKVWGKDSGTKFRTDHGDGNYPASSVESHVEKVAQKTGGKVKMVSSVDEITNKGAKAAIEEGRKITGWYDEKTGEVHLYMPNIHDRYTAEKTIWHEVVGHKGMRELFGEERFEKFLRDVWYDLDKPENAALKKLVDEERKFNPMNIYDAIEEGIARLAEDGKGEAGFWNGIKNKVSDFLHEIGYRIAPNTKDVKYLLWLSKNLQKNPNDPYWKLRAEAVKYRLDHEDIRSVVERNGMYFDNDGKNHDYLLDLNHKDFEEATDGKVHFRTTPTTASKIEEYNRRLATKLYAFKESTVDHMQSLQEAMEVISGEKDVWNNIPSSFNPLMAQNSMDSKVQQVSDSYDRKITEPLGEVFQKVVALVDGKNKDEQLRNAQLYMITKHGLERNRVFFVRDAIRVMKKDKNPNVTSLQAEWAKKHKDLSGELEQGKIRFDEYLNQMDEWIRSNVDISYVADEHDYSGFHGMQKKDIGEKYDDRLAIDNVMSVERKLGGNLVKDFWSKKKAATDYIIDQQYTSGFADEVERDYLKGMFQWYVPLRKFDDTTAEDVYGYITEKGDITNYVGPTLANAKGRSSLSDVNVLAQISAMAKASIINGGKNVVKQHLARFISAYENGDAKNRIFVEINPWAEKHTIDGNEVWEEVTPQIPEDATQEQISNILQSFENSMKAKQASGDAKLLKNKADIGFKFQRAKNKSEHIVDVYIAGKKKSFVCQGNPRAAQAINGLLVDSGTRNAISEIDAKITRKLAQFNTSFNPDFMSSNMLRDLTSASANVTKEGFKYTKDFLKEYAGNMRSITNLSGRGNYLTMFRRYREDKLDMNNEREKMFKEFMDNGGQTGFIQIKKFEDLTKEYDNLIKKGNKDADRWLVKKIKKGLSFIEAANEIVEGIARYSTYCTSRKHGRSIGKSVYDAKEVSGNFNRHGSGDAIGTLKTEYDSKNDKRFRGAIGFFNSWMKNHTQFYNAGVQGANLLFKNYKSATITTAISFGFMPFGLGLAQALINQYLISREDEKDRNGVKDPYAELPEWKRRNNICIYWGHCKFKTIPLGIELRASFGIGDIAAGYVVNENLKSDTPIGYDILGQIAQLIPASDFLGHHSPSSSIKEVGEDVLLGVTPTTIEAFGELGFNRDWTGRPFYRDKDYLDKAPRWKSAYDNTSDIYMTINKWANQSTNGIDASNPDMKGNETLDYLTAPYGWQHVIDSYTGGMGSTIRRAFDTGSAAIKGVVSGVKSEEGFGEGFSKEWSKFDKNQIPLYRVFNYTPSEGNNMQRTKSKWYNYTDEFNQIEYNLKQMRTDTPDLVKNVENHGKLYKFTHGDEGKAFNIWKAADDYIYKKRRDMKKTNDPVVKKSIEEQINIKMQEAVNDLDKLN